MHLYAGELISWKRKYDDAEKRENVLVKKSPGAFLPSAFAAWLLF